MGADQQFCLRWNNFHSNITSAFESLRDDEDFVDITLACEGRQIKAHKMVLSACSPYFRSLLKGNPCQHPIVFLKDVTFANLTSILDFMYHGEVNVSHNELATFLKTAEALKVRGLAEDEKKKDAEGYNESSSPPPSRGEPPDPGSSPRPEEGGSAPDTHLSGDSPQPPPSKRQRRRSAASLHSAEDNTSETVLSEGQRDSSASVKNEPQEYPEDEDNMLASSAPATLEPQDLIKSDLEDPDDRSFGPSDSVTISRSQAAMQQLQESFGSFLPGMGQAPSGFLPQGATDLPRPPPYPLEGVQGLPPGISALPGPSMSQGASQEAGQVMTPKMYVRAKKQQKTGLTGRGRSATQVMPAAPVDRSPAGSFSSNTSHCEGDEYIDYQATVPDIEIVDSKDWQESYDSKFSLKGLTVLSACHPVRHFLSDDSFDLKRSPEMMEHYCGSDEDMPKPPSPQFGTVNTAEYENLSLLHDDDIVDYKILPKGSKRGRPLLVASDGFKYVKHKTMKGSTLWRCVHRHKGGTCQASIRQMPLVTTGGNMFQRNAATHCHGDEHRKAVQSEVKTVAKHKAVENPRAIASEPTQEAMVAGVPGTDTHWTPRQPNPGSTVHLARPDPPPQHPKKQVSWDPSVRHSQSE